ncbi:tubby-like F-box protein 5 [Tanacetum coccineum]
MQCNQVEAVYFDVLHRYIVKEASIVHIPNWLRDTNMPFKCLGGARIQKKNVRGTSHIAPINYESSLPTPLINGGQWESLPYELLLDIIKRVEAGGSSWPARQDVGCLVLQSVSYGGIHETALAGDLSKLLLAAKKVRKATGTEFLISLAADDFSRATNTYVGKLR